MKFPLYRTDIETTPLEIMQRHLANAREEIRQRMGYDEDTMILVFDAALEDATAAPGSADDDAQGIRH